MWVLHTVATQGKFLRCTRSADHTGIPPSTQVMQLPSTHPNLWHKTHVPQQLCWPSPNNLIRLILPVKANKNQGDYREVFIQAARSCCYRSVFICSSDNNPTVLFGKNLERALLHSSGSSSGCCTPQQHRKGTSEVCVCCWVSEGPIWAGKQCHNCACQSASRDGCWINSNVLSIPVMGTLLCVKRGCLDLWLLPGQTALLLCHKTKTSTKEIWLPS